MMRPQVHPTPDGPVERRACPFLPFATHVPAPSPLIIHPLRRLQVIILQLQGGQHKRKRRQFTCGAAGAWIARQRSQHARVVQDARRALHVRPQRLHRDGTASRPRCAPRSILNTHYGHGNHHGASRAGGGGHKRDWISTDRIIPGYRRVVLHMRMYCMHEG